MSYERPLAPSHFPACCALMRTDPTLGFSLNPFRLIKKIIKPALVIGSMFVPGGFVVRTAIGAVAGRLASKVGGGGSPATPRLISARMRDVLARAQAMRAAQSVVGTTSALVSNQLPPQPSGITTAARPADLSTAAAGGAEPTEEPQTAGAKQAGPGIGIGIAVVAGIALLALSGRKR